MNRMIKFRGKTVNDYHLKFGGGYEIPARTFVYGNLVTDFDDRTFIDIQKYSPNGVKVHYQYLVDAETIGQYTGLKDKNRKEIYEGDIVTVDDTPFNVYASRYKGEVVMYRGSFSVKKWWDLTQDFIHSDLFFDDFANHKIEVIGNIHDNPELLKGGQE